VTAPEDFTDYDDGPDGRICGYDWYAHLATDAVALVLVLGSAAGLAWVTLASSLGPF
jgi:hypothetical protein